jgi:hypothetical protein
VAYTTTQQVQQWAQQTKYQIQSVDAELEQVAVDTAFTLLGRRYDTATWLDSGTTPSLVLDMITMLVAAYTLRRAFGEEDGSHEYPDWLEMRAMTLLEGISAGLLDIPGVDVDPSSAEGSTPAFFPTDAATDIWFDDPTADGGAARYFTMEQIF